MLKFYYVFCSCFLCIVWFMVELGFDYEFCQFDFYLKDFKLDVY